MIRNSRATSNGFLLACIFVAVGGCQQQPPPPAAEPGPAVLRKGPRAATADAAPQDAEQLAQHWQQLAEQRDFAKLFGGDLPTPIADDVMQQLLAEFAVDRQSVQRKGDRATLQMVRRATGTCYLWSSGDELRVDLVAPTDPANDGQPLRGAAVTDPEEFCAWIQERPEHLVTVQVGGELNLVTLLGLEPAASSWERVTAELVAPKNPQLRVTTWETILVEFSVAQRSSRWELKQVLSIAGQPPATFFEQVQTPTAAP